MSQKERQDENTAAEEKAPQSQSASTPESTSDTSSESPGGLAGLLESNQQILLYLVGGMIFGVLAYFGYKNYILEPKKQEAVEASFVAQQYFSQDSLQLALRGDGNYLGFLDIADEYGGTPVGNLSNYYIGLIYLKQGNYQQAVDYLEEFDTDSYLLEPMKLGALGNAHTELDNFEAAADYFLEAANLRPNDLTTPRYLFKAGLLLEKTEQYPKAQEVFERLQDEYGNTNYGRDAPKYLGRIEARQKTSS
jgi:tetratricopeptide (TPR) repeat protein